MVTITEITKKKILFTISVYTLDCTLYVKNGLFVISSEIEADFLLKDEDLDLAFIRPSQNRNKKSKATPFNFIEYDASLPPKLQALDEVVSLGKLGRNLYRKSTLQRGWVNAVIEKPRDYYVIENVTPGTPVFDQSGRWVGITAFRKEGGKPSGVITVPAKDVMEIAEQVRERAN